MKTKSIFFSLLLGLFVFSPFGAFASNDPIPEEKQMTEKEFQMAMDVLKTKVDNLKDAKREADTPAERKALRKEIKDVKKEARELKQQASGGIYIGGGALIVIILLLILL